MPEGDQTPGGEPQLKTIRGGSLRVLRPTALGAVGLPPSRPGLQWYPRGPPLRRCPRLLGTSVQGPATATGPVQPPVLRPFTSSPSSPSIAPPPPTPGHSSGSAHSRPATTVATRPHLPPANIPGSHWLGRGGACKGRGLERRAAGGRRRAGFLLLASW